MKKFISFVLLVCVCCGFVSAQAQVDPMNLPKLTQWVTDFSATMTADQLSDVNSIAKAYETQTSNQVVAVVFPNRNGNELIDIGMKIFKDNGIGQKDKDNGLLLLIASEEKKIRIIVGYGLEGVYPDLIASQVIENDIRPLVNGGDIAGAIRIFYERSKQIIAGEYASDTTTSSAGEKDAFPYIGLIIGFFLGMGLKRFLKGGFKALSKPIKALLGIGLSILIGSVFLFGIYLLGSLLLSLFFGLIFGLVGIFPGGFGRGGFSGGGFGGGGGFDGGGGGSGGGGAGD